MYTYSSKVIIICAYRYSLCLLLLFPLISVSSSEEVHKNSNKEANPLHNCLIGEQKDLIDRASGNGITVGEAMVMKKHGTPRGTNFSLLSHIFER